MVAARFEDGELASAVDLQVAVGIEHRVEVARLAGEVEEIVLLSNEVAQAVLVADVRDVDVDRVLDSRDVEQIAAVLVDERVDERDLAPQLDELAGEVRADEAETRR